MTGGKNTIDDLLAAVMRGDDCGWPADVEADPFIARIAYHGIAGLLNEQVRQLRNWPVPVKDYLRDQGIALAMWELRHKALLGDLLDRLAEAGVSPLLLKGTALAYDLYPLPATRARGDTDLLVGEVDLVAVRRILEGLGYALQSPEGIADDLALQEVWSIGCGSGTSHHIDLHWQLINAPALTELLEFAACNADPLSLPRLGLSARAMSRPLTLLHSCIHRAMHLTSPYFVNGVTYYGGDRLIWARDIDLLAAALSQREWRDFAAAAIDQGVAAVCRDGLALAQRTLKSNIPAGVMTLLETVRAEQPSAYLLGAGQARRAWLDFRAIPGWRRKLAYVGARSLPSARFMRGKYPRLANRPLALLHVKRMIDLLRPRRSEG